MIEKKEKDIAVQSEEVMDLLVELVKVIKNKGDYTSLIDDLMKALEGLDEIPEEAKNIQAMIRTIGPKIYDIVEVFTKKENVES